MMDHRLFLKKEGKTEWGCSFGNSRRDVEMGGVDEFSAGQEALEGCELVDGTANEDLRCEK